MKHTYLETVVNIIKASISVLFTNLVFFSWRERPLPMQSQYIRYAQVRSAEYGEESRVQVRIASGRRHKYFQNMQSSHA